MECKLIKPQYNSVKRAAWYMKNIEIEILYVVESGGLAAMSGLVA